MRRLQVILAVVLVIVSLPALFTIVFPFDFMKWFTFSSERALDEWETKIFKGRVIYDIDMDKIDGSLHALSKSTASAIFYRIKQRYRAQDYPMLSWRWRVVKFPDQEKLRMRQGIERDDYASRVYVIFPSFFILSSKVLEYVWDETAPLESITDSPYSSNIKLIVAESGRKGAATWVSEERNILEDYRRAFGLEPSLRVGAIALMSDADNTADVTEAYFDDIKIGYKKEK